MFSGVGEIGLKTPKSARFALTHERLTTDVTFMLDYPSHIHFFSWSTRVSIELPAGFEVAEEDDAERFALYADDLDDDDPWGARVQTRVAVLPSDTPGGHLALADAALDRLNASADAREEHVIDHCPAVEQTLRYRDNDGDEVLQHAAYVQAGDLLFSIVAQSPGDRAAEYLPVFREMVRSVRLILV
ncbi:MAG: hypothetical protein JJU06_11535 [Ectothiorhodospiraceae bacterium]|nr:hypothetical protein [Ectothiorhodospiraceae bacterium]MCH8503393.1 hypothetical protein [Ectothiorhodospiraceae bacterium]